MPQTREFACTKVVLPQVLERGRAIQYSVFINYACAFLYNVGLHVTEVAHDIQQQVSRYVTSDLSLVNSYDTWHGNLIP